MFLSSLGATITYMRYKVRTTHQFDKWLKKQSDRQAVRAIAMRIARVEQENKGHPFPSYKWTSTFKIYLYQLVILLYSE